MEQFYRDEKGKLRSNHLEVVCSLYPLLEMGNNYEEIRWIASKIAAALNEAAYDTIDALEDKNEAAKKDNFDLTECLTEVL